MRKSSENHDMALQMGIRLIKVRREAERVLMRVSGGESSSELFPRWGH